MERFAEMQAEIAILATSTRALNRRAEDMCERLLPNVPTLFEERADKYKLRRTWRLVKVACLRSKRNRRCMYDSFNHWRFRPQGAGMVAAQNSFESSAVC